MAVKILEVKRERCPAARFIGKKYEGAPNWCEWWENIEPLDYANSIES